MEIYPLVDGKGKKARPARNSQANDIYKVAME